jgi:hypothetical protein
MSPDLRIAEMVRDAKNVAHLHHQVSQYGSAVIAAYDNSLEPQCRRAARLLRELLAHDNAGGCGNG